MGKFKYYGVRVLVSIVLFAIGGYCYFNGPFDTSLLLLFLGMVILPAYYMPFFFEYISVPFFFFGIIFLLMGYHYRMVMCAAIFLTITIKLGENPFKSHKKSFGSSSCSVGSSSSDDYEQYLDEEHRRHVEAECQRNEAERLSFIRYGCDANTAAQWDNDIRNRLQ